MNNALLWIGGLAVALLAALFGGPHLVDWNSYRGTFEEEASRILGRDVRVAGDVNLRLLPAPYVEFERIRVADGAGTAAGEPLFRADRFTMWLSVSPLLRGVVEAKEIMLKRPVVRLSLDAEGQGNWRTLAWSADALPFIPAGIALQSVKITRGTILVQRRDGEPLGRVEDVTGELSAEALDGPYKFSGTVKWAETEREVRIATARPDPGGAVRFKGSTRAGRGGNEYVLDGQISDLGGKPRLAGALSAKVAFEADRLAFDPRGKVLSERPVFDLKAAVEADGNGVALRDIALSFESVGQPQLITGEAKAAWSEAPRLDVTLASRWLDLDRISGAAEGAAPLAVARALLNALVRAMPGETRTATSFAVDQVALGGEAVSGLAISLVRSDGPLRLERLRADLPGARLDLEGELSPNEDKPAFKGKIGLHGANLGRFLAWAGRMDASGGGHAGGAFAVRGHLDATAETVSLTDAVAELAGTPVEGDVKYDTAGRRKLDVRLEGRSLDLAQLWPGANLAAVQGWLHGDAEAKRGGGRPEDVSLKLRLGELGLGDQTLRDVDAALAVMPGRIAVSALSFKTPAGLAFALDGDAAALDSDNPTGALRWTLEAASASAVEPFLRFAGGETWAGEFSARAAALMPLRLAGSTILGRRGRSAADISLDGMAGAGRLAANLRLDGGWANWRDSPAEIAVTIETPDIDRLARGLAALPAGPDKTTAEPPRAGKVFLAATGVPAHGLAATGSLDAEGLQAGFDGAIDLPAAGATGDFKVRVTVAARRAGDVLALAGLPGETAAGQIPIEGAFDVERKETVTTITPKGFSVGSAKVSGAMTLSAGERDATRIEADLDVSEASLASLLAILLDGGATEPAAEPGLETSLWPGAAFNFAGLDRIEGRIGAKFAALDIGGGLGLAPAKFEARLSPGKVEVTAFDGTALGATLGSTLTFAKQAAGVALDGALRLTGLRLGALKRGVGDRTVSGDADIAIDFRGQALSPSALVAALNGSGTITLRSAKLSGFTPGGVGAAADGVLLGRAPGKGEGLVKALLAGLAKGELQIGSREIPVEIRDGALRIASFSVETDKGRTTADIAADLATLKIDSEWKIEPKPAPETAKRPPLPPITVVYVGSLAALSDIEPRVGAEAFERELTVRRLEQDVGELERLRKEDEERVRIEADRAKALEAERALTEEAPPGGGPADPAAEPDWPASTTPGAGEARPGSAESPASRDPPGREGLTNATPPRPRKPPAFNPWDQLDRSLQN